VRDFIRNLIDKATEEGEVRTLFGRRREVPQLRSRDKNKKAEGERIAINTPIQGTAADIIKLAMIRIHRRLSGMKTKMILQVHDELVFEVPEDELERVEEMVREEMESVVKLEVPLRVDVEVGKEYH
jgi:DNA polymerase-1